MSNRINTAVGYTLACILVFVAVVTAYISIDKFLNNSQWMVRTMELRNQTERLSTLFMTAQNNLRAYYASGQEYYLEAHQEAVSEWPKTLDEVKRLSGGDPKLLNLIDVVSSQYELKNAAFKSSAEIYRTGGWPAILKLLRGDNTKSRDQALFAALQELEEEQSHALERRSSSADAAGRMTRNIVLTGGILGCLLIILTSYFGFRDRREREQIEQHIDRFFNLSLDLLCISGMDGYFKRLSPSFTDVLGYSLQELYTRPIMEFIHPEDRSASTAEIEHQAAGNRVLSFENRFVCKNGAVRILSWKSVPVDGFMYAVARDVTQQKRFENELLEARESAQNAAGVKSIFLATMSHEIRTPLNGVVGMSDLLSRTTLDKDQKNYVNAIRGSATALLRIVNEILDFSKIEAGSMHAEKIDFNLRQTVEAQISLIGILASEKGLRLESDVDEGIPSTLRGDGAKIGQVLVNLLNNAVKFTDHGTIRVRVELMNTDNSTARLRFSVSDKGIGMSQDQIANIFKPFAQADGSTARKYGGTGLGLSICKRMVELMGGEIGVESRLGEGSTFWFAMNLEISSRDLQEPPRKLTADGIAETMTDDVKARRKAIRILIAEDNQMNQMIALNMMEILGYTAEIAKNGQEAVDRYKSAPYDMILMDQHMPVMDGIQASREIRELEKTSGRHVPIIAFTATVIQQENIAVYRDLMDDFILKPVTLEVLETTLGTWERRLRQG